MPEVHRGQLFGLQLGEQLLGLGHVLVDCLLLVGDLPAVGLQPGQLDLQLFAAELQPVRLLFQLGQQRTLMAVECLGGGQLVQDLVVTPG
ncbi:MAG: hypothetical protein GEU93_18170 [Propionibacteriales bacterium]|nr:hypothetical protein [Propionibacteriales bacterium]